jgi:hypothetical protein
MRPLPPSCRPQRLIERTFGPVFSQTLRNLPIRSNIAPMKSVPFIRNAVGRELQILRQPESWCSCSGA